MNSYNLMLKQKARDAGISLAEDLPKAISVNDLQASSFGHVRHNSFDGEKFEGGYGATTIHEIDYWTLRQRSGQLFTENPSAKGIIRRLITNLVNTGLLPEASPLESILGYPEGELEDWTEIVESRFQVWADSPLVCHWAKARTFAGLQRIGKAEALISGDVLVVMRQGQRTQVPSIELVSGELVQSPLASEGDLRKGHRIVEGVELDSRNVQVAFWVRQEDNTIKRMAAYGAKTGRLKAWLLYGTELRLGEVRGQPLLACVLQWLKDIDRYQDSAQRKALINSLLAMFIKKTADKPSSLPGQGGATSKQEMSVPGGEAPKRSFNMASWMPGMVFEELQVGEEPVGFNSTGTDLDFPEFKDTIINGIAWALEIPPGILKLQFSSNYAASQGEINEFRIYQNKQWSEFGEDFCGPIYKEWLISEVLKGKVECPGLIDAWRDESKYDIFGAWTSCEWFGAIKPSSDMLKTVKAGKMLCEQGFSSRRREARAITGSSYKRNVQSLERENERLAKANKPMLEMIAALGVSGNDVSEVDEAPAINENSN